MRQTTLSVPLEVKPKSAGRLASLIDEFRDDEDRLLVDGDVNFARLLQRVPLLHFMSMSVFDDPSYDPIFVIEANLDGEPGPFWAQLEALAGEALRDMLRCCKSPLDEDRELFQEVTRPGSRVPIAPYLEARTQTPSVFFMEIAD